MKRFLVPSVLIAASTLSAATLYWDGTGTSTTPTGTANGVSQGNGGTFSATSAVWDNGTAYQTWNPTGNTAVFGATGTGTGGTVVLTGFTSTSTTFYGTTAWSLSGDLSGLTGTIYVNTASSNQAKVNYTSGVSNLGATGAVNVNVASGSTWYQTTSTGANVSYTIAGLSNGENLGAVRLDNASIAGNVTLAAAASIGANSGGVGTISGVVSDGGSGYLLTKQGGGTINLSGINTFTGGISVAAGTLGITGAGQLGSGSYAGAISTSSGATFGYNSSAAQTLSGAITNAGALSVSSGAVTLSGSVSGAGSTAVSGGTLALDYTTNNTSKLSTGALTLSGGALSLAGNAAADTTQSVASLNLTGAASLTLATQAGRTLTFDNSAGTRSGTGVVNLATTGAGTGVFKFAGTTANSALGWATWNNGLAFAKTDSLNQVTAAGQSTLNASASDLSTWTSGATQYTTTGSAFINSVGSGVTIDGVTFNDAAARTVTIGSGNTLTLNAGVIVTSAVGANTSTITGGTIRGSASGVLNLVNNNASGALTVESAIADNGGATGLAKYGAGTVIIKGDSNAFSGPVTVNGGELRARVFTDTAGGARSTLGSGVITVNNGANLRFQAGSNTYALSYANAINLNGSNFYHDDGTMTMSGTVTSTGTSTINGVWGGKNAVFSNVVVSGTGSALTLKGASSDTITALNIASGATFETQLGATTTIGTIAGAGSFTLNSTGNLTITGDNSALGYSGNISLIGGAGGTFTVNSGAKLVTSGTFGEGWAKTNVINGVLTTGAMSFTGGAVTSMSGSGTVNVSGLTTSNGATDLTVSVSNLNVGSAGITVSSGSVTLGATTVGALANWSSAAALRLTAATTTAFDTTGGNITLSGAVGNATTGALTKIGSGTLTLSGNNTYTGATTVNAGTLRLSGTNASAVTVNSGGTLSVAATAAATTTGLLTMNAGATLAADASTTNAFTSNGVNFAGATSLLFNSALTSGSTYYVLNYGAGGVTNFSNLAAKVRGTLTDDSANSRITFTAGTAGTRTWNTTSGTWDNLTTANFSEGDRMFSNGDTVVFNDPASASVVTLAGQLVPASVSVNNTNDYTFSGSGFIAGTSTLTKNGTGTLTISTANTNSGAVAVSGGTLKISGSGSPGTGAITIASGATLEVADTARLGGGAYATAITDNGTLKINTTANQTLSGVISGAGALVKDNTGTLSLSANNGFTGGITVNGGVLALTGGGGGTGTIRGVVTVNAGGTLSTSVSNSFGYNGGAKIDILNINGGTVTTSVVGDNGWGITVNMTGGNLSSTVTGGYFSMGGGASINTLDSASTATIGANLRIREGNTNNRLAFTVADGAAATDLLVSGVISEQNGSFGIAKEGAGRMLLTGVNTYTGATLVNAGTLEIGGAGQLGSGNYAGAITIASGATFKFNSTANQVLSGTISGAGDLVKDNTGTLTLSAIPTYAGTTTINGGTLALTGGNGTFANGASFGGTISGGVITINNGATLAIAADNTRYDFRNQTFAFGATGGGSITTGTNINWVNQAGWTFTTAGGAKNTISGNSNINANSSTVTFDIARGTDANADLDVLLAIGNTGSTITKSGTGILRLQGVNTYTGATAIAGGVLEIGGAGQLGSGNYAAAITIASGATLRHASSAAQTFAGSIGGGGTLDVASGSTLTWNGSSSGGLTIAGSGTLKVGSGAPIWGQGGATTYAMTGGQIRVEGGTLTVASGGDDKWTNNKSALYVASGAVFDGVESSGNSDGGIFVDALTGAGTVKVGYTGYVSKITFGVNNGTGTFDGVLANSQAAGNYTKAGTGTQTLTGVNTYTGATAITGGVLEIGGAGQLGSGAYAGAIANAGTLKLNSTAAQTLSGVISGSGALQKANSGTLTLSAINTYSGGTTLTGGKIITGNGAALGTGAVSVAGGTLQVGAGNLAGIASLTVNTGTLDTTLGTVTTTGAFALAGGTWVIGNTADAITAGSFTLTGGVIDLTGFTNKSNAGTYSLISGTGSSSFTDANFTNGDAGFSYAIDGNGDLVVTAVPEPSTYGLLGAGALAAAAFVRRRRKAKVA